MASNTPPAGGDGARPQYSEVTIQAQLAIQKIYLKDVSFEAPQSPQAFLEQWQPSVELQLNTRSNPLDKEVHEVVLTVTATVKSKDVVMYLIEVEQAGVFSISGVPAQHLNGVLATACPNILFPFAREAVSELVSKGGFPPLLLAPVNFEALYGEELKRQREQAARPEQTH